jgi:hypothetical protein
MRRLPLNSNGLSHDFAHLFGDTFGRNPAQGDVIRSAEYDATRPQHERFSNRPVVDFPPGPQCEA